MGMPLSFFILDLVFHSFYVNDQEGKESLVIESKESLNLYSLDSE